MKAAAFLALCIALFATGAPGAEVHGASDAYAGEGVTLAWGVLRGATDADAIVVLRVRNEAGRYSHLEAVGIDPFTREEKVRFTKAPLVQTLDIRLSRAGFADHPRTELRFSGTSGLVVYYLGIPDTTPEFASAAALEGHLATRLAKLRSGDGVR